MRNEVLAHGSGWYKQERVDALNARKSPIIDAELSEYLADKDLNLSATTELKPH